MIFSTSSNAVNSLPTFSGGLLRRQKSSIAVAESCTGGLVAHWLTDSPGASDYCIFSGVTYSNRAKIDLLGVLSETIERFGTVHEETAKEMAKGVRRITGATYGLSISGIAGPDGGTEAKPVGTVCIGLAAPDGVEGRRFNFSFGKRSMNKVIFAEIALDLLRIKLLKADQTETIS
ncbi:MAG TPA: CinA family protein [Desulfobacterales bacterium]|nr:CinA family protein [Desulfobacterales bacterium]